MVYEGKEKVTVYLLEIDMMTMIISSNDIISPDADGVRKVFK